MEMTAEFALPKKHVNMLDSLRNANYKLYFNDKQLGYNPKRLVTLACIISKSFYD